DIGAMPEGIVYLNQPQITKVEGGDPSILDTDPLGFASTVRVELYFEDSDKKPDYLDLVVMKNGDTKNIKTLQANISTYPTDVEISGQQLTELFGDDILRGDSFDIGANYVVGGKTYAAFPEAGQGYGAGVSNQPGASPTVRFSSICGFDVEAFVGDFEVVEDGWADFGVGTVVTVEAIDENTIAIPYTPVPSFNPIMIDINTGDNTADAARQGLGDTEAYGLAYGTIYLTSTGGGT